MSIPTLDLTHQTAELKKLIAENPDLPIAVLVGQDAAWDDFGYTFTHDVSFHISEILDADTTFLSDTIFYDRDDFAEKMSEYLYDTEYDNSNVTYSEKEFELALEKRIKEYDPYWKKCICIYADN